MLKAAEKRDREALDYAYSLNELSSTIVDKFS
jgi:hypothetical protein